MLSRDDRLRLTDMVDLVQVNRGAGWGLVRGTEFWVASTGVMFVFFMFYLCTKTVYRLRSNVLKIKYVVLNIYLVVTETMLREMSSKSIYMSGKDS